MKHSIQTAITSWVRGSAFAFALLSLLAATAFAPRAVQAQVVFDTFDDGDVMNVDVFFGGADGIGAGVGPTDGIGGMENTALSLGINPGAGGGFAGAAVVGAAGVDASGSEYLTFYVRPTTVQAANLPLVLEVNLQEDANGDGMYTGATEDEYQANYRLSTGSGYTLVQIPLASFTDDNSVNAGSDDGFDFSSVINVVYAIGGIPAGPEFALAFDEIIFYEEALETPGAFAAFDTFDDGDVRTSTSSSAALTASAPASAPPTASAAWRTPRSRSGSTPGPAAASPARPSSARPASTPAARSTSRSTSARRRCRRRTSRSCSR